MYSASAASDKCTLFADRNLINRRNVKNDTHHAYDANKQMLLLAVKARVIAAAAMFIGLRTIDDKLPTKYPFPADMSRRNRNDKIKYINQIASR